MTFLIHRKVFLMARLDIVLELKDNSIDDKYQTLNMTELVVFGPDNEQDGIHLPLVQASSSPRQWKVEASLKL